MNDFQKIIIAIGSIAMCIIILFSSIEKPPIIPVVNGSTNNPNNRDLRLGQNFIIINSKPDNWVMNDLVGKLNGYGDVYFKNSNYYGFEPIFKDVNWLLLFSTGSKSHQIIYIWD